MQEARCSHSDISPCPRANGNSGIWVDHPVQWPKMSSVFPNQNVNTSATQAVEKAKAEFEAA